MVKTNAPSNSILPLLLPLLVWGCADVDGDPSTSGETDPPTQSQAQATPSPEPTPTQLTTPSQSDDPTPSPTADATPSEATAPPTAPPQAPAYALSPRQLLIRGSLDLRGVRPSEAEYAAIEANPEALDGLIQSFLHDPRFGDRVVSLFAPIYRTQLDRFEVQAMDYGLEGEAAFNEAVGDEALRLLAYIATEDLPYTELVTADYTLATPMLIDAWGLEVQGEAQEGWQIARYNDLRPAAGVLGTNSMWWRYPSDGTNYNRGRANALSRILLCNDYASRPVNFDTDIDLTDEALVQDALKTNPGCINCHSSLDPLASYLFGYQYVAKDSPTDASIYHPERERLWQNTTGTAPAYYGSPGYTMVDLSHQIAGDPRFIECAVEQVFEALMDRQSGVDDIGALTKHREAFLSGGLTLKALISSVLQDPRYRDGALGNTGGSIGGDVEDPGFRFKVVSPDLLATQVEALTGYRFTVRGGDMLRLDRSGLRSLAGGADGASGASPQISPTATLALVHQRIAEGASYYVANHDSDPEQVDTLFKGIDFTEVLPEDRAVMAAQVQALHYALFGQRVAESGPEVEANLELWGELYTATGNTKEAWAGLLSALLRDPEFIFY